jgi:signal transduction histidine kinase
MEDKGTLALETGTAENSVFVKISDTGPGIPSDLINRIFDPFFSTKSEKGGTGLGLSIAKRIIRENNGRIEVTSEKGTTFTITLPI